MALHGARSVRGDAVLWRHDSYNGHQRLSAGLLPRRLRRGQRVDHGQPQLGRLYGDIYSDRLGDAARAGEGSRHSSCHYIRLHFLHALLANIWEAVEAVARSHGLWNGKISFVRDHCV